MKFTSIAQYFARLHIVFLILLMVPLLVFIVLYLLPEESNPESRMEYYVAIPAIAFMDWVFAVIFFNKKIKSARNEQGLGAKLQKYFNITIVRYCFLASSHLVLALGFFLTRGDLFTALYLASLILSGFFWPTGPKVSGELMLRGDEREMVYLKKDQF
jgi:hypothetical protein